MRHKIIFLALLILVFSQLSYAQETEKIFVLHIIAFKNNTIKLKYFGVEEGVPTSFLNISSNYVLKIISVQNEVLFQTTLPISFTAWPEGGLPIELNETTKYFRLPYFENAKKIEIYFNRQLIFVYNICQIDHICEPLKGETVLNCCRDCSCPSDKVCINNTCIDKKTFCGNSVCESFENYKNCPKDCPSGGKDGYCDGVADGICDPDCVKLGLKDPDCKMGRPFFVYAIIIAVVIVLLALIAKRVRY